MANLDEFTNVSQLLNAFETEAKIQGASRIVLNSVDIYNEQFFNAQKTGKMILYDYLFFKSYQLAQKSKNFDDTPVLGGIFGMLLGFLFNIFTVILVIDGTWHSSIGTSRIFINGRYVFAGVLVLGLLYYYRHNGRWKKIIEKYEEKEKGKGIHPIIVLILYYIISFGLGTLASLYKTGDLF